jgi:hypothetical protein
VRFHAPGDPQALAAGIAAMLAAPPSSAARAGLAAWARERHPVERMLERYLALF